MAELQKVRPEFQPELTKEPGFGNTFVKYKTTYEIHSFFFYYNHTNI